MEDGPDITGCAPESAAAGVPLAGTGPSGVTAWFILEDRSRWAAKAVANLDAPESVRTVLLDAKGRASANVVLARGPCEPGQRRLWFAWVGDGEEALFEVTLPDLLALEQLPVDRLVQGDTRALFDAFPGAVRRLAEPLVLVCAHGQRDRCCALLGAPVAQRLAETGRGRVLRTTHLGGHRFAPTGLVLPLGLMYGRMDVAEPDAFFDALERREILSLQQYRGRSCWPRPVQAALHAWREERGVVQLDWVHVLGRIQGADGSWQVALTSDGAGPAFCEYRVRQQAGGAPARKSCRDEAPVPTSHWVAERVDG